MRKWRVGTVSMGASLILLGIFLFLSQINGLEVFSTIMGWWPLILVVLGLEILLYIFFSNKESPIIKYDVFSILFVGLLGTIGIIFTILLSTGVISEIKQVVSTKEQTINLPTYKEQLSPEIEKVVIQTENIPVTIEGITIREIHLLGTFRTMIDSNNNLLSLTDDDVISSHKVGNTIYLTMKELPKRQGMFHTYMRTNVTLLVPNDLLVEVRGNNNVITLYPGVIKNNWFIKGGSGSQISVFVPQKSDIELLAYTRQNSGTGNVEWDTFKPINGEEETGDYNQTFEGKVNFGDGTYKINIINSHSLTVNLIDG